MVLFLQPIYRFPTHSRLSIYTGFRFGNSAGTPEGGWEGYRGWNGSKGTGRCTGRLTRLTPPPYNHPPQYSALRRNISAYLLGSPPGSIPPISTPYSSSIYSDNHTPKQHTPPTHPHPSHPTSPSSRRITTP